MLKVSRPHIYDEEIPLFVERPLDQIKLEIGYSLIPLFQNKANNNLMSQLTKIRERLFDDYGLSVPLIHIQDNVELRPEEYRILLKGVERGRFLCKTGFDCITTANLITNHIYNLIENNKTEILNQSMVSRLVNNVREKNPDVVSDIFFTNSFSISNMKTLLNLLLKENVPIHDMDTILEAIADNIKELKKPYELVEKVREKLAFSIVNKLADENKCLHVIKVSVELSDFLYEKSILPSSENDIPYICIESTERRKLLTKISNLCNRMIEKGFSPVFLCIQEIRLELYEFLQDKVSGCIIVSAQELQTVSKEFSVVVEEELSLDEE